MKIGNWKYSVYHSKCPRCNLGDLWENKRNYSKNFSKMLTHCDHCNLKYDMEQGFWYGAMYISYALGVFITVTVAIILTLFTNYSVWLKSGVASAFLILFMPLVFRYSRVLWINVFVHFDKKYFKKSE